MTDDGLTAHGNSVSNKPTSPGTESAASMRMSGDLDGDPDCVTSQQGLVIFCATLLH